MFYIFLIPMIFQLYPHLLFRSYSFIKNVPILLIQRVDSRRLKNLESKVVGISSTNDMIPETKVYDRQHHEFMLNLVYTFMQQH